MKLVENLSVLAQIPTLLALKKELKPRPLDEKDCLARRVEINAERFGDRTAIVFEGRSITWAEFNALANRFAHCLQSRGLRRGAVASLLMENRIEFLATLIALNKLGVTAGLINTNLRGRPLAQCINTTASTACIFGEELTAALADVKEELALQEGRDYLFVPDAGGAAPNWALDLAEQSEAASTQNLPTTKEVRLGDTIAYLFTSGTTGLPKGARITHGMTFVNTVNFGIPHRISADSVTLTVLPLFHTGALNAYANPVLPAGGTVVVARRSDPEQCLALLADPAAAITHFLRVPANFQFMAQLPAFATADFSHVAVFGVGAAPTPNALIEAWAARGAPLAQVYGMTETAPVVLALDPVDAARKVGSAGKPLLYTRTRVMAADGRPAAAGETGELQVAGPNVTPGYWNKPQETTESFDGEWLKTGDAVRVDEDGYYYIVDRWKDMYISGGENVYPAEVENALYGLDGIAEAAVIGIPDDRWGEVGCAVIVPRENAALAPQDILDHCAGRLARFKQPRRIVFTSALPRSATGKVRKHELRRMAAEGEMAG